MVIPRYHPHSASLLGSAPLAPLTRERRAALPAPRGARTAGSGVLRISRFAPAGLSVGGPLPLCCAAREWSPSTPVLSDAIVKPSMPHCQGIFSIFLTVFFIFFSYTISCVFPSALPHFSISVYPKLLIALYRSQLNKL